MSLARARACSPSSGAGGCLREGVARRPWMAGGMGTDGTGLTPAIKLRNQSKSAHDTPKDWVEKGGRSIKVEMARLGHYGG
jgi:hypothetical protein